MVNHLGLKVDVAKAAKIVYKEDSGPVFFTRFGLT